MKKSTSEILKDIFLRNPDKLSTQSRHKGSSIVIEIPDYTDYFTSALGSLIGKLLNLCVIFMCKLLKFMCE
jgi:hypothetical protein